MNTTQRIRSSVLLPMCMLRADAQLVCALIWHDIQHSRTADDLLTAYHLTATCTRCSFHFVFRWATTSALRICVPDDLTDAPCSCLPQRFNLVSCASSSFCFFYAQIGFLYLQCRLTTILRRVPVRFTHWLVCQLDAFRPSLKFKLPASCLSLLLMMKLGFSRAVFSSRSLCHTRHDNSYC